MFRTNLLIFVFVERSLEKQTHFANILRRAQMMKNAHRGKNKLVQSVFERKNKSNRNFDLKQFCTMEMWR